MNRNNIILIGVLIVILLGVGFWYWSNSSKASVLTYTNPTYNFSFNYPADWKVLTDHMLTGNGGVYEVTIVSADKNHSVRFLVLPKPLLGGQTDTCAGVTYRASDAKWVLEEEIGFTDDVRCTGGASKVTVVGANGTVGEGIPVYVIDNSNPSHYLVPMTGNYGLSIEVGDLAPHPEPGFADPVAQPILASLKINK